VSAAAIALSLVPPGDAVNKFQFELKLVGGTGFAFLLGTALYYRGARAKERADLQISAGAASRQ